MSNLQVQGNIEITIEKKYGITQALKKVVESNPNSVLTDGKITLKQWQDTMDALIEIQNNRLKNKQAPIFSGGTDKSSKGWKNSFVVHPNQKIEFTPEEMQAIYSAMGVTIKSEEPEQKTEEPEQKTEENEQEPPTNKQDVKSQNDQQQRYELSWSEIGTIGANSGKNFVKGMFCDENGFSLKQTGITLGTILGLSLAAPITAKLGGSKKLVKTVANLSKLGGLGLSGWMAYNGGKDLITGTKNYYHSTNEADAKQSMAQAWDGGIEAGLALPAFFTIRGGANKGNKIAEKRAKASSEAKPAAESKPANEAKPSAEPEISINPESVPEQNSVFYKNKVFGEPNVISNGDGTSSFSYHNIDGQMVRFVRQDANGNVKYESRIRYNDSNNGYSQVASWSNGTRNISIYDDVGRIVKEKYRYVNNTQTITEYNPIGRQPIREIVKEADGSVRYEKTFKYNEGNLVEETYKWNSGDVDVFANGSNEGVRISPDGKKYKITLEDNTIKVYEEIKPEGEVSPAPAEATPSEVSPQQKPQFNPDGPKIKVDFTNEGEKNLKAFIDALLQVENADPQLVKSFVRELKYYSKEKFDSRILETALQDVVSNWGSVKTYVHKNKIYIDIDNAGVFEFPLAE